MAGRGVDSDIRVAWARRIMDESRMRGGKAGGVQCGDVCA